jgi:preprotein translocase subunit YajC
MFKSISFLILISTQAHAQAAAAPGQPGMLDQLWLFAAIFAIFYFLMIRPQSKRHKEHQNFLANMKRGDSVVTASGIYGKVEGITEKFVTLEVSDGVNIRILKSQIATTVNEGAPNA